MASMLGRLDWLSSKGPVGSVSLIRLRLSVNTFSKKNMVRTRLSTSIMVVQKHGHAVLMFGVPVTY